MRTQKKNVPCCLATLLVLLIQGKISIYQQRHAGKELKSARCTNVNTLPCSSTNAQYSTWLGSEEGTQIKLAAVVAQKHRLNLCGGPLTTTRMRNLCGGPLTITRMRIEMAIQDGLTKNPTHLKKLSGVKWHPHSHPRVKNYILTCTRWVLGVHEF
jgi:hypothetical protein